MWRTEVYTLCKSRATVIFIAHKKQPCHDIQRTGAERSSDHWLQKTEKARLISVSQIAETLRRSVLSELTALVGH